MPHQSALSSMVGILYFNPTSSFGISTSLPRRIARKVLLRFMHSLFFNWRSHHSFLSNSILIKSSAACLNLSASYLVNIHIISCEDIVCFAESCMFVNPRCERSSADRSSCIWTYAWEKLCWIATSRSPCLVWHSFSFFFFFPPKTQSPDLYC